MKITKTTIIEAPASLVFRILLDVDLATTWVPNLTSYKALSKRANMVGSTYLSQINYNGMQYEQTSEIKSYVENQFIRWSASSRFCDGRVEYHLTQISDIHTELTLDSEWDYKGFSKFCAWLFKSKTRQASEDILDESRRSFKSLVEMTYWSGDEHP